MPPRKKKSRAPKRVPALHKGRAAKRGGSPKNTKGLKRVRAHPRAAKRPWYDRLSDRAERLHWRAIDAKWREDQAREAAEREIAKDQARAFRIVKWHKGITGRGARLLSAVVGKSVYQAAEDKYGGEILKRAAVKIEVIRKDREKIRKAALDKIRASLLEKKFTMEEVERFQVRVSPRIKIRTRHFHKIYGGRRKGQWKLIVHTSRGPKLLRYIKTERGLESAKAEIKHRKRAVEVANHLGLTFTQARSLVREVEVQAVIDLHKLKKTKAFKDLPARKKLAYTERRWKAGSVAVLYALADIEGYR